MSVSNNKMMNQKLKHFEVAVGSNKSFDKAYVEWIVQKLGNVNKQVIATDYLNVSCPEVIGCTALHVAASNKDLEAFKMLLSCGADYTLKDQKGMTVLHSVVKSTIHHFHRSTDWISRLENSFVTAILTAHIRDKQTVNPCDPNGFSHFHAACMANNLVAVELFLNAGVSINDRVNAESPNFSGFTALHFAAKCFSFDVLKLLLQQGANVIDKDTKGMTLIHVLLERNFDLANLKSDFQLSFKKQRHLSEMMTKLFFAYRVEKDEMIIDESGLSYLHVACAMTDMQTVELILKKDVNVNRSVNVDSPMWPGYTGLHIAAIFNLNTLKLLVTTGADLEAKDVKGVTPLDLCLERYKVEDVHSILLLKQTWKNITFSDNKTKLLDFLLAMKSYDRFEKFLRRVTNNSTISLSRNSPLWPGFTPMHLVVLFAKSIGNLYDKKNQIANAIYLDMLTKLFDKDNKMIEAQDIHGQTPLHLCFRLGKMINMTNLLIKFHQELDQPVDLVDEDNLSLLHIACANNNENLVIKLLSHNNNSNLVYKGKSICKTMTCGWSPLHAVIAQRKFNGRWYSDDKHSSNIVRTLLKYGANVNNKDTHQLTPVHLLVIPDFKEHYFDKEKINDSVGYILLSSPHLRVCVANDYGLSHLHIACFLGKEDTVRKLVASKADVNGTIRCLPNMYKDFYQYTSEWTEFLNSTPLHISMKSSTKNDIVNFLIDSDADIFAKNSKGVPMLYEALKNENSNIDNLSSLVAAFRKNPSLQIKVENEIGLTSLHIACRMKEVNLVKKLLENGVGVNAKIKSDSLIWSGYTPLHIAIRYINKYKHDDDMKCILELLLNSGADVTVANAKQRTPLHVAYQHYIVSHRSDGDKFHLQRPNLLLDAQKDFSINPKCMEGITHFHIACSLLDTVTIKKFLIHGDIDVDQSIDFYFKDLEFFKGFPAAGCTSLHLAVMSRGGYGGSLKNFNESTSQLETADLLLNHGADVNAENAWGETPFHIAAFIELRERLVRSGANVNAKDAIGYTTLERLLRNERGSSLFTQIKDLLRFGCHYNAFNCASGLGYIGLTFRKLDLEDMQKLIIMTAINYPNLMVDELGRTVIHNLVSTHTLNVTADNYTALIGKMTKNGCDVDDQDQIGRTALHVAVKFKNLRAISGLLLAGADINITDINGKTAFEHKFKPCPRCSQPTDAEDEQCEHYKIFKYLAVQVKKLQLCGLDVHRQNENIAATTFSNFGYVNVNNQFVEELEKMKYFNFKELPLTLHQLLSELDTVVNYSYMSPFKKSVIDEFFLYSGFYLQFSKKYGEIVGLLQLQYRKAVKRTELLRKAKISLDFLADIRIPELCSCIILRFLKNSELENIFTASKKA